MATNKGILLYDVKKDDEEWILYWIPESGTLGLTNYIGRAYEVQLDTNERKKLMRNCAESLLDTKWRNAFKQKAIQIGKVDDESAQLKYVSQVVELPKIDDANVLAVLRKLFFNVYSAMLQLSTERENKASPSKIGGSPAKRLGQSEPTGAKRALFRKPQPLGRRTPGPLLRNGVVFNDIVEKQPATTVTEATLEETTAETATPDLSNISPMKA